jgi:alcohol dehydrogenase class IV
VVDAAGEVIDVPAGRVDELAGALLATARGDRLVALGGGRVVDTAKALAAAAGGATRAMAIPTTLSGAEMTTTHRAARGAPDPTARTRAAVIVTDPAVAASQPGDAMAASALNALAHAVEGPCTRRANPVATLAAAEAARLLVGAFPDPVGPPDRGALALGALLAGYAIDSTGYGLHHVASQTLAREGGVPHAVANAALLPHTIVALERRAPGRIAALESHLDTPAAAAAARLAALAGAARLRDHRLAESTIPELARLAAARPDLDNTPPRATEEELAELYRQAY